jgi:predicted DNA binding protein
MTVTVVFTVSGEEFALGRLLGTVPEPHVELERVVPVGVEVLPYLWVRGGDPGVFERTVSDHESVDDLVTLDRLDGWRLYSLSWARPRDSLLAAVAETGGTVLSATRDDDWSFRLRFPDHEALSRFYERCTTRDIALRVSVVTDPETRQSLDRGFELSDPQREALLLALRRGYFDTPGQVSLRELATEFDITEQALSDRIRRGTKVVLEGVLRS